MQKEELFGFQSPEMQNTVVEGMWGSVNLCAAATLCPLPATFPVDGLVFGHHTGPFNHHVMHSMPRYGHMGNLTATNWWTYTAAKSLQHTHGTHQVPFSSAVFTQHPAQCAPHLSDLPSFFRELRTKIWIWQWKLKLGKMLYGLFPIRFQAYSFLFSYKNSTILKESGIEGFEKN